MTMTVPVPAPRRHLRLTAATTTTTTTRAQVSTSTTTTTTTTTTEPEIDDEEEEADTDPNRIEENIRPTELTSFTLDLDSGYLVLQFDGEVRTLSFDATQLVLCAGVHLSSHCLRLTGSSSVHEGSVPSAIAPSTESSSSELLIILLPVDLNSIKSQSAIGRSLSSTFLSWSANLVQAMGELPEIAVRDRSKGMRVTRLVPDTTAPAILSFDLLAADSPVPDTFSSSVVLVLTANEPLDATSIDIRSMALQTDSSHVPEKRMVLQEAYAVASGSELTKVHLHLSLDDTFGVRARTPLGRSVQTTFLSLSISAIRDQSGNALASSVVLPVSELTADFELALPSTPDAGSNLGSSSTQMPEATTDGDGIVPTDWMSEFESTTESPALQYPPRLLDAELDMSLGVLSLFPNSPIFCSSLDITRVTIQSSEEGPMHSLTLTGGEIYGSIEAATMAGEERNQRISASEGQGNSGGSLERRRSASSSKIDASAKCVDGVFVLLSEADLDVLRETRDLADGADSSFLVLDANAMLNTKSVPNAAMSTDLALGVRIFIADQFPPRFLGFGLDLALAEMYLTFSEAVNRDSVLGEHIALQNSQTDADYRYHLTGGDTWQVSSRVVGLRLTPVDARSVNAMAGLAMSRTSTFLLLTAQAAKDYNGNHVIGISEANAVRVSEFTYGAGSVTPESLSHTASFATRDWALTAVGAVLILAIAILATILLLQRRRSGNYNLEKTRASVTSTGSELEWENDFGRNSRTSSTRINSRVSLLPTTTVMSQKGQPFR
eukprot:m.188046 g.188046  ORF g.188046 m.188046 type:complete len:779 (-) comp10554_c2_seq1:128-2464(-)